MSFGSYTEESVNCTLHGPLKKPGRTISSRWICRYYILKDDTLIYYKAATDETPSNIIILRDSKIVALWKVDKKLFGFLIQSPSKTHTLFSFSEEESQSWIDSLKQAIRNIDEKSSKSPNIQTSQFRRASHIAIGSPPNFKRTLSKTVVKIDELYELGDELGSGGFSTVYTGTCKADGSKWALKLILNAVYRKNTERINEEIRILGALDHPGVVRLKEVIKTSKHVVLVMDRLIGGDLFDRIVSREKYSENDAKTVAARLLDAVAYLHRHNICHRDLKPENLIFDSPEENAMMKVTDFGFATIFDGVNPLTSSCGTPEYVAPEILDEKPYGLESDMWSCGVIIYILLCGFPPFYGETENEMFDKICSAQYAFPSPFWDFVSEDAKNIINSLLVVDPKKRLTAEDALEHVWLKHTTEALSADLSNVLGEMKRFQATRKFRKAVIVILAVGKLRQVMSSHGIRS